MATVAENFTSLLAHEETEATPRPKDSNAPNLFASSREPLPYDPMLGWYTAATLSGLLLLFLACVGLEKIKGKILMAFDKEHQQDFYRDSADPSNPLAVGIDQGLCRSTRDNAKGSAEDDALLGTRNCIDHNYVYLTLDRPNPAQPDPPNDPPPPPLAPMHQRSPTRQPHAYKDREWKSCDPPLGGPDGHRDHGCRTNSTPTLQTHSVKIEIVEVHSETPIHDFPGKDVQDTAV